ncbi:glycoside hydrolase family 18 protein [Phycisphaeraceae bacterium D3-23]
MKAWLALFLTMLLSDAPDIEAQASPAAPPVVAGYAPHGRGDWSVDETLPLTDILYFSVEPTPDGGVDTRYLSDQVGEEIARLHTAYAEGGGVRILLCVGGWGRSEHFAAVTADDTLRARLVAELAALCETYGFDGIDFDWEHPQNAEQLADYTRLLVESAAALHPDGRMVTVAQAGWQDLGLDAYDALGRVHLMSYDHDFPQATFEESTAEVERLIAWGCPPEKIALGLPFYGRNEARDAMPYRALVARYAPESDDDLVAGFACNSPATVSAKTRYALERGLAGVMVWQVYQDAEGERSLLGAIAEALAE